MTIIVDFFKDYFNYKQLRGESLLDYTQQFKIIRDVLTSYLRGPIELQKYVANHFNHIKEQ